MNSFAPTSVPTPAVFNHSLPPPRPTVVLLGDTDIHTPQYPPLLAHQDIRRPAPAARESPPPKPAHGGSRANTPHDRPARPSPYPTSRPAHGQGRARTPIIRNDHAARVTPQPQSGSTSRYSSPLSEPDSDVGDAHSQYPPVAQTIMVPRPTNVQRNVEHFIDFSHSKLNEVKASSTAPYSPLHVLTRLQAAIAELVPAELNLTKPYGQQDPGALTGYNTKVCPPTFLQKPFLILSL